MPTPRIGSVRKPVNYQQGRAIPRIGPAPYPRSVPSIGPANYPYAPSEELAEKYDWFKPINEQLQTLKQQPIAQVGQMLNKYLGDPTEPSNMNLAMPGWMKPEYRIENLERIFSNTPKELLRVPGVKELLKKYKNTAAHMQSVDYLKPLSNKSGSVFFNEYVGDGAFTPPAMSVAKMRLLGFQSIPSGRIEINPRNQKVAKTLRHELGHAALALKNDPVSTSVTQHYPKYGYNLDPAEIRAEAIALKESPSPRSISKPGSYVRNDYLWRLQDAIKKGLTTPENWILGTPQDTLKKNFISDLLERNIDLPSRTVTKNGKLIKQPFRDWVEEVNPRFIDYLRTFK